MANRTIGTTLLLLTLLNPAGAALGQANLINNGDFEDLALDEFDQPVVDAYGNNLPAGWFHKQTTPAETATPATILVQGDDSDGAGEHTYGVNYYEVSVGNFSFPGEADLRSQAFEAVAGESLTWSFDYKLIGVDQNSDDQFRGDLRFFEDLAEGDPSSTGSAFITEDLFFSGDLVVPDDAWQSVTREIVVPFNSPESSDDDGFPAAGTVVYGDVRFSVNAFTTFNGGQVLFDRVSITRPVSSDYNGDGLVDAADYTVWRDTLGSTTDLRADGDGSSTVDQADYDLWRQEYGSAIAASPVAAAAAAPEPGACCLALMGVGYRLSTRRRTR